MNYGKDFYQGTPALTVNQYGKGYAYYICADAEELFYHDFYAKILAKHHIHSILNTIPDGIEVTSRTDDEYEYIFIQNFSYRNIDIVLPKKGGYHSTEIRTVIFANMKPLFFGKNFFKNSCQDISE